MSLPDLDIVTLPPACTPKVIDLLRSKSSLCALPLSFVIIHTTVLSSSRKEIEFMEPDFLPMVRRAQRSLLPRLHLGHPSIARLLHSILPQILHDIGTHPRIPEILQLDCYARHQAIRTLEPNAVTGVNDFRKRGDWRAWREEKQDQLSRTVVSEVIAWFCNLQKRIARKLVALSMGPLWTELVVQVKMRWIRLVI